MLQQKLKECYGCKKPKSIWKNSNGKKWCIKCWNKNPDKKQVEIKPKTQINKKSPKQKRLEIAYMILRNKYLLTHPFCQAGLGECTGIVSEVHHKAGKIGSLFLDDSKFLAVCRQCHNYLEMNPLEAKELGFSESRLEK